MVSKPLMGYMGKILRVDLTSGAIQEEPLAENLVEMYMGGSGFGADYLYREVPPGVAWDDPENRIIIASGPLGGTLVSGTGTFSLVTKGPMTGLAVSTQANGFLGAFLKFAGFDGVHQTGTCGVWDHIAPQVAKQIIAAQQPKTRALLTELVVNLVKGLPSEYEITVCCYDSLGPLADRVRDRADVLFIPRKPGFDLPFIFKLRKELRGRKIDVLHAHNHTAFFYGTLAAKLAGVRKVVYTEHGRTGPLSRKARFAHRMLSRFVDRVVVVADCLKEALVREEVEKLGSKQGGLMMIYGLYPGVPLENAGALMDAMERYMGYYS